MQIRRITSTTLITLLTAATTSFAANFLALFPTSLALAQTPIDLKPGDTLTKDQIHQIPGLENAIRKLDDDMRERIEEQQQEQQEQWREEQERNSESLRYQIEAKEREANELLRKGTQQFKTGQFQAALKSLQRALRIYRAAFPLAFPANNRRVMAWVGSTLNSIGEVYYTLGQNSQALKVYQQALDIHKPQPIRDVETGEIVRYSRQKEGDKVGEGTSLNGMGLVYTRQGQYTQAVKFYQRALDIFKQVGNKAGEGATLNNVGELYRSLGQYTQAVKYHQQALAIVQQLSDKAGEGRTLNNIGLAFDSLGQYADALKSYRQALNIAKQEDNKAEQGRTLNNIGALYNHLGGYSNALKFYQQALDIAKQVGDKAAEGTTLNDLGAAYSSLGQYPNALKFYQQALDIAKQVGDKAAEGKTLTSIGQVYHSQGQYPDAERTLVDAIGVLESLRFGLTNADRVWLFEIQANAYRLLQQALIAQKKTNTALEVAERGRARAFVELLSTRLSSQPTIHSPFAPTAPPTLEEIQKIAKTQNATLVEYSITYNKVQGKEKRYLELYIWVVKPTGEVVFRKVDHYLDTNIASVAEEARVTAATGRNRAVEQQEAILSNLVRGTRDSISKGGSNTAANSATAGKATSTPRSKNQHLQQLHQLLIQPIADLLPTNPEARVIFVPQGALFLTPFPALQDANGKYLIEKHTILTTPAIQVLQLTHQQWLRAAGKDMLVVGNPTMPSVSATIGQPPQPLAPLPGAEQEAIEIASLLNTKAITGDRATEAALKQQMPKARIIHLATHGLLDDFTGGGVPGAIALAPSGKDNGLLTADEILDLKLTAELVVLSACDTGRGRITGDGVIGLSRSLFSAGVPSVVVSLWKVPDQPTAALMSEFYRRWQRNRDQAAALRQAMLTTMKKHPKPRDWAAFTLIGEAR